MSKILVKVKGNITCLVNNDFVPAFRPAVVANCNKYKQLVDEGKLKPVAELKDEATDQEFFGFIMSHDGDIETATENFLAKFGIDASDDPEADVMAKDIAEAEAKAKAEAEKSPAKKPAAKK